MTGNSTQEKPEFLTFKDLMGGVGEFVFYWASMEVELGNFLQERGKFISGPLSDRLATWRAIVCEESYEHDELAGEVCSQIYALRQLRNLIVHGLVGGHSQPEKEDPYILIREGGFRTAGSENRKVRYSEIEHFVQAADACRRAMKHVSNFNYRLNSKYMTSSES